jgi:hypothetical protein
MEPSGSPRHERSRQAHSRSRGSGDILIPRNNRETDRKLHRLGLRSMTSHDAYSSTAPAGIGITYFLAHEAAAAAGFKKTENTCEKIQPTNI